MKQLQFLQIRKSGVRLDISIIFDTKNSRQAVITCINELLEKHHFDVALNIAQIENLPPDLILIKEKTLLSTRLSSFSSCMFSINTRDPANSLLIQTTVCVDSSMNDILAILKLLSEHLCHSVEIGQNIFMSYRISINIETPYQIVVVTADYMKILKYALEENCMNKLDVVHDFVLMFKWSKHELDLTLVIELLIRAHDCFTADCNMEEISVILKKSKEVISNLLIKQDWKLIKMKFEFLLRKGLKKDNAVKVALLEYFKRFCPDNRYGFHATDFHLQGEKLSKAMISAKQAELIALQLGILTEIPTGGLIVCLLDLNNNQVFSLISSKLSFEQFMILIEAYNFHVDRPSVLIASELGFTDLIEDLIASGQLVYLKDTVWKKGYKN
ncbi:spatacsin [Asbolus verrucosus]|uniref:Spatacsin n=1 Tax=Asbolus verrucosus TaxID=1661398 RepID=A0A482VBA4_ASBVE|nr:spatacsin [Asbolus verrucosus]